MRTVVSAIRSPYSKMLALFAPREGSLFSPALDVLLAGGISVFAFIIMWVFVREGTDINSWSLAVYYAAFFVNYPHFMASYQLIYADARPSFTDFKRHRVFAYKLWWAGLVVPLVLIAFFLYALLSGSLPLVGYLANLMFFFVGWHYIKQIYGCVIVLSSAKKVYYSRLERWSMLVPLYSLWAISFVNANLYGGQNNYYQIVYNAAKIPEFYLRASYVLLALSTFVMLSLIVRKFITERNAPPLAAMVALLSIYIWYIPALSHPFYLYVIPLFHSLQYLLFVAAYERNRVVDAADGDPIERKETRRSLTRLGGKLLVFLPSVVLLLTMLWVPRATIDYLMVEWYGVLAAVPALLWMKTAIIITAVLWAFYFVRRKAKEDRNWRFFSFFFTAFLLGVLLFVVVPTVFDIMMRNRLLPGAFTYNYTVFGVSLYLYFFTILINIHHYFIDNVIWKSNNPHIRAHLFAPKL